MTDWKKKLKDHLRYEGFLYVAVIFLLCTAFSMLFSMTKPEADADKRVHILVASSLDSRKAESWSREILALLPEEQEEVEFLVFSINEGDYDDSEVLSAFYARLLTHEGDLMVLPYWLYEICAQRQFFVPLSDAGEDGVVWLDKLTLPEGVDPERDRVDIALSYDENDVPLETHSAVCGIPLDKMMGLWDANVNPSDMVACVPYYSENKDNAIIALQWLLDEHYRP